MEGSSSVYRDERSAMTPSSGFNLRRFVHFTPLYKDEGTHLYVLDNYNKLILGAVVISGVVSLLVSTGSMLSVVLTKLSIDARFSEHQKYINKENKRFDDEVAEMMASMNLDHFSKDCMDIQNKGFIVSNIYVITVGNRLVDVYCDMETDGGGWTVIQLRKTTAVNFNVDYQSYVSGFGSYNEEFWFGLELMHQMTTAKKYTLRIELGRRTVFPATYSTFSVGSAADKYKLTVGGHSGDIGDSLSYHNNQFFSTFDNDNDANESKNCAVDHKGGWWFRDCLESNLNGDFFDGGLTWNAPPVPANANFSVEASQMKIRPA